VAASVQRRKIWLTPNTGVPCSNAAKTRNQLNLAGVPQTTGPISAASGSKFTILCGHVEEILLLNSVFPIVDTCLSCEDMARRSCAMVRRWPIFGDFFWVLHFQRTACSIFQTCVLNSHQDHIMCRSMVDIHSATAEISEEKRQKKTSGYATWFTAGGAIRIAHYDVIDDVITRKL